jgi:hypothetical protein
VTSFTTAATQMLTGVVTDEMCGNKHTMMPGTPDSECIRACIKAGRAQDSFAAAEAVLASAQHRQMNESVPPLTLAQLDQQALQGNPEIRLAVPQLSIARPRSS